MKALCINLKHREDRWKTAEPLLVVNGFDVKRYDAFHCRPGWRGCTISHMGALSTIKKTPFAIFEDDIEFTAPIEIMHCAIEQVGAFDMLYLGCDPQSPMTIFKKNVLRLGRAFQTHAIIYGSDRVVKYILSEKDNIRKLDVFFAEHVIPKYDCYATYPMVVKQTNGYSDITRMRVEFDYIKNKYESMIIKS